MNELVDVSLTLLRRQSARMSSYKTRRQGTRATSCRREQTTSDAKSHHPRAIEKKNSASMLMNTRSGVRSQCWERGELCVLPSTCCRGRNVLWDVRITTLLDRLATACQWPCRWEKLDRPGGCRNVRPGAGSDTMKPQLGSTTRSTSRTWTISIRCLETPVIFQVAFQ